ncbi:MAG TPA: site-specific DNA-methyltransferase [Steroidobacteraceae bacterium]|nr:site-specific DNA-methyltransferase [Steroidobacteraceae bacterium]
MKAPIITESEAEGYKSENPYSGLSREALVEILRRRDAQAHYGLVWERKDISPDHALNRDFVGFELDEAHSCGKLPWRNLIIEGDNYDALRSLVTHYAGQIKLIYIDPPYNTGRRDFVYNDRFVDPTDRFRHSIWLEFMFQRLKLARDLLSPDGAIFVSVDDHELFNLGLLMNQVFGEKSFVANCIWQKRYSRENREAIGDAHEYLLVYSPNPNAFKVRRGRIPLTDEQARVYRNPDNPRETNPKKRWRGIPLTAQGYRPNQMYEVVSPTGKKHRPPDGRCWSLVEPEFRKLEAAGRIYWGKDGSSQPSEIRYLSEVEGAVPWTWWPHDEVGHTDEARKEIQALFGTQTAFDTPKPTRLMRRVLAIGAPEKDALVLDFFAGSGTFGQAVLQMNREDGGERRFILVANTERTEEEPKKNIARDVCAARLRKVIEGYRPNGSAAVDGLGGNFAYLKTHMVPMHRLDERLTDAMIWTDALLLADHPTVPLEGSLGVSVHQGKRVVYCADAKRGTIVRLRRLLKKLAVPTTIVTWTPARIRDVLDELNEFARIVAVPDDLRRAFRRGPANLAGRVGA